MRGLAGVRTFVAMDASVNCLWAGSLQGKQSPLVNAIEFVTGMTH
jgi:hypothetical protein